MKASDFLTKQEKQEIVSAIARAELNTSGEIRVHIEKTCKGDELDRATLIFAKLKMHKTQLRNGVLIYVSILDRKLAILGDVGINQKVPEGFWNEITDVMIQQFRESKYMEGLIAGIGMVGDKLKVYFPHQQDDTNELSNEISFGK